MSAVTALTVTVMLFYDIDRAFCSAFFPGVVLCFLCLALFVVFITLGFRRRASTATRME